MTGPEVTQSSRRFKQLIGTDKGLKDILIAIIKKPDLVESCDLTPFSPHVIPRNGTRIAALKAMPI